MHAPGWTVLLSGVVGSTAYGLSGPDSDVDMLAVGAVPTEALHGLHKPQESHVTTGPDFMMHEAGKFCRLALGANPTVTEVMWLETYEHSSALGGELIDIRGAFLSAKKVRDAYLGYADQQFQKLKNRGDGTFSSDTAKRTAKHARHVMRLVNQGYGLYATGTLHVRLENPQNYLDFGEQVAAGDLLSVERLLLGAEMLFDGTRSVLPERPDEAAVEAWLRRVRRHHYNPKD